MLYVSDYMVKMKYETKSNAIGRTRIGEYDTLGMILMAQYIIN